MIATTGSNGSLYCSNASGSSELEYSWERTTNPTIDTLSHVSGISMDTLTLLNVGVADATDYICRVSLFNKTLITNRVTLQTRGERSLKGAISFILSWPS